MKKFSFELKQITFGEDDIQTPEEVEKIINHLGIFSGVETVGDTVRIVFKLREDENTDLGRYYCFDFKIKETES